MTHIFDIACNQPQLHMNDDLHNGLAMGYLVGIGRRDLAQEGFSILENLRHAIIRRNKIDTSGDELALVLDDHENPEYIEAQSVVDDALQQLREFNERLNLATAE